MSCGQRRTFSVHHHPQNTVQHAGIPPILQQLDSGDSILGFRRIDNGVHNVTVERVALSPIFILRNFVTSEETKAILSTVSNMEPAQTASGLQDDVIRKNSFVAWLGNDKADGLVKRLADAIHQLLLSARPNFGVEDLQVLRYDPGGEYVFHHDGNGRILTVLYYLNDEGETFFPLAQVDDSSIVHQPQTREEALHLTERLKPGVDGLLVTTNISTRTPSCVPVRRGDAVAFYSYLEDGTMDWNALHAGLPASNEKFVANHFFRYHLYFSEFS